MPLIEYDGIHICECCEEALAIWISRSGIYLCDDCAQPLKTDQTKKREGAS